MTREEIKQVAENYASQMCNDCSSMFYCKDKNIKCVERREREKVFADGAKRADEHPKNVWHDASEMPKDDEWILVRLDEDSYDTFVLRDMFTDIFITWCKRYDNIRWTYIRDLLPKGGEL